MKRPLPPPGHLVAGIARLAFFNASGFAAIGNTRQAFLSSLSPLVAFVLVGCISQAARAGWRRGLANALFTVCILVGQPVISHLGATLFKREALWLRYATAMNWCQLVIPVVALVFTLVVVMTGVIEPSEDAFDRAVLPAVFAYALALNTFLAWRGLKLSLPRAMLFVLVVAAALGLLVCVPTLVTALLHGTRAAPSLVT